jgi:hypothetical protein
LTETQGQILSRGNQVEISAPGASSTTGSSEIGSSREEASEPRDILEQAVLQVPGLVDLGELRLLRYLASQSRGTIVELGAFHGLSTIALCLGARHGGVDVVTVDAFVSVLHGEMTESPPVARDVSGDAPADARNVVAQPSEMAVRRNLAAFGVFARVVNALSWEAAEQVDGPVGLLLHDADHTRPALEKDLAAWGPKLARDAVVVFHDYAGSLSPDVAPFADEWAVRQGFCRAETEGLLQVYRPMGSSEQRSTGPGTALTSRFGDPGQTWLAEDQETRRVAVQEGDVESSVRAYLAAYGERDLPRCLEFFAQDAVIQFAGRIFRDRQAIEQWHRARFEAGAQIARVDAIRVKGDVVTVDAAVTSRHLRKWRIRSLRGRATVHLERGLIRLIYFGIGPLNPFKRR